MYIPTNGPSIENNNNNYGFDGSGTSIPGNSNPVGDKPIPGGEGTNPGDHYPYDPLPLPGSPDGDLIWRPFNRPQNQDLPFDPNLGMPYNNPTGQKLGFDPNGGMTYNNDPTHWAGGQGSLPPGFKGGMFGKPDVSMFRPGWQYGAWNNNRPGPRW
jgi:hypothetical protein